MSPSQHQEMGFSQDQTEKGVNVFEAQISFPRQCFWLNIPLIGKVINKTKRTSIPLASPTPSQHQAVGQSLTTWVSLEALATASPRSEKYLPETRGVTTGTGVHIFPQTLPKALCHPDGTAQLWEFQRNVPTAPCAGPPAVLTWKLLSGRLLLWS